jgi:hypothetical protein
MFLGNQSAPLVSPDQARLIVGAFWPLREDALNADDAARTDDLESGVAREYDDAVSFLDLQVYRGTRRKGLRRVRTYSNLVVFVPARRSIPSRSWLRFRPGCTSPTRPPPPPARTWR